MNEFDLKRIEKAVQSLPDPKSVPYETFEKAYKEICHNYCKYYHAIRRDDLLEEHCCHCPLFRISVEKYK